MSTPAKQSRRPIDDYEDDYCEKCEEQKKHCICEQEEKEWNEFEKNLPLDEEDEQYDEEGYPV